MSAFGFFLDGKPSRLRNAPCGSTMRRARHGSSTGIPWSFRVSFHRVTNNIINNLYGNANNYTKAE